MPHTGKLRLRQPPLHFTNNFARRFVLAQTFKRRVPEQAVVRPLGKTDLRHQLWFQPAQLRHFFERDPFAKMTLPARRQIREWTLRGDEWFHFPEQTRPTDGIESLPDFADGNGRSFFRFAQADAQSDFRCQTVLSLSSG